MVKGRAERGTMRCHPSVKSAKCDFLSVDLHLKCVGTEITGQMQIEEDTEI